MPWKILNTLLGNLITIINYCKSLGNVEKSKEEQQKIKKIRTKEKNVLKIFSKDFIYNLNLGINTFK